jgi:hypothetical protein
MLFRSEVVIKAPPVSKAMAANAKIKTGAKVIGATHDGKILGNKFGKVFAALIPPGKRTKTGGHAGDRGEFKALRRGAGRTYHPVV